MEVDRVDGRTFNQRRPVACTRGILHRAHGSASWAQGETKVIAAVYGPKSGTRKNENPEKACIEVIWKPKTGQSGKPEREYEMVLKKTLQSICLLNVHPNTTTSIVIQVVNDDGAVHATEMSLQKLKGKAAYTDLVPDPCKTIACAALVDAGTPLKHLSVAVCCCMAETGHILIDPSKIEEKKVKAFVYLVFPNSIVSVLPHGSSRPGGEVMEHGIITSVTHGVMEVDDYFNCLKLGRAAAAEMSDFLRSSLKLKADPSKAG